MASKNIKWIIIFVALIQTNIWSGPPFNTDDPEPVDYLHWEFYLSSIMQFQKYESDATLPHIEINYGAIPNLQIHLLAPMGYVHNIKGTEYGFGNTEFGIKYRFAQETDNAPQIGVFPLVEIPTGNKNIGLGNGNVQIYLPIWFQKSWEKFTTYGGVGYWINPGEGNRNWIFTGWEAQYDFSDTFTLGGEIYYHSADSQESKSAGGFSIGGFINLTESNHILFSYGHSVSGQNLSTGYLGYQLTI